MTDQGTDILPAPRYRPPRYASKPKGMRSKQHAERTFKFKLASERKSKEMQETQKAQGTRTD
jgi:hypothetical protein